MSSATATLVGECQSEGPTSAGGQDDEGASSSGGVMQFSGLVCGHPALFLVDSGSTRNFLSTTFAQRHQLGVSPREGYVVETVTGSQDCTHVLLKTSVVIDTYQDELDLDITDLGRYDVILGMPWLRGYDPQVAWRSKEIQLVSRGMQHTLHQQSLPSWNVQGDVISAKA